ncbi:hypothetical protein [Methanobrevibacter sp.]|uniref:hypothetical protein n=1 Tax=Methanobrevibacter sp. TaxID=66852 RepID=UPI0025F36CE4|nr:hypothetical protein [Methanobrevibacter sp.]MBQ2666607.1 hypothetical protein [Methanobrevibacter sp.]
MRPGTYTAKLSFENNNYVKTTNKTKITVKKATPKLTAKAKKFKQSVKTKKILCCLEGQCRKGI